MVEVNKKLFNYPVSVSDEFFNEITGINLRDELNPEQDTIIQDWLNSAHESVYNRIYKIGGKTFKDNIIRNNIDKLEKVIQRCIILQLKYMLESNGDYGIIDGSNTNSDGQLVLTKNDDILDKVLAPKVVEVLKSARPNLLMGE